MPKNTPVLAFTARHRRGGYALRRWSFFGRKNLVDSDGRPLSCHIECARAGAGVERDITRLAVYDVIAGSCSASITKMRAGRKPSLWHTDRQDCIFEIADDIMQDWLESPSDTSLTDILKTHVSKIRSTYPVIITEADRAKWQRLFSGQDR